MSGIPLYRVKQQLADRAIADVGAVLRTELVRFDPLVRPGASIAIGAGSRGIDNLALVVREVAAYVRSRGAQPFVVPAMGSHGGAQAEGQAEVLRSYGIDEPSVGAPVRSCMDTVALAGDGLPMRIFMDRLAFESDGVILVNRIKPHTDFHATYESGLMKMALIGLGKRDGAEAVHRFGVRGLRELIEPGARRVLASGRVLGGVALVEDARHRTMAARALSAAEIPGEEPKLLASARQTMARLPVDRVDVLIVDRMGKDISGVGIDPNVTGRVGVEGAAEMTGPRVRAMMVRDLTEASHGNAIGVGLADVITRQLYDKIDFPATYANVVTSGFLERGKIPIVAETDRDAFDIARRIAGDTSDDDLRVVRIADTLSLEHLWVSRAILAELRGLPAIQAEDQPLELFTNAGRVRG